jgi:hypothetical protein
MYHSAYCELKSDFNNAYFDPKIDSIKNVIQQSVYNDPKKFYSNTKFDSSFNYDLTLSGPGGIVVFGLKNFIANRETAVESSFLSNNITCWPLHTTSLSNENPITIYPNPATGIINIKTTGPIEQIQLFTITGTKISQFEINNNGSIDLSHLSKGLYCIKLNGLPPQKLVLE